MSETAQEREKKKREEGEDVEGGRVFISIAKAAMFVGEQSKTRARIYLHLFSEEEGG